MIFDSLCRIVDNVTPSPPKSVQQAVDRAALFVFEGYAHKELPKSYPPETVGWFRENFFLPFPFVAIEDPASCIIVWNKDHDPNARGLFGHVWSFVECMPVLGDMQAYYDGSAAAGKNYDLHAALMRDLGLDPNICVINVGELEYGSWEEGTFMIRGTRDTSIVTDGTKAYVIDLDQMPPAEREAANNAAVKNASTAIQEIMFLNAPDKFILETIPDSFEKRMTKRGGPKKTLRSHERPLYTVLRPDEIRKKMKLPEPAGTHASPRPHERRAHVKVLRSPFYKNKQGQAIVVSASWVGPSENKVGNKKYRVLLEK